VGYGGVLIKPIPSEQPRNLEATSRYMLDLAHDGEKVPHDEFGPLSGSMNCIAKDRRGQLREFDHALRLHGDTRSTQAASHQVITYPTGFRPTRRQIERDLRIALKKYGMEGHALIWDAHDNTPNFHVHFLLCRVSLKPDAHGKYRIADNGFVKKSSAERNEKTGKVRVRTRTCWASCRQIAIAEICGAYGWEQPRNVRRTPDGKPLARQDPKDRQSDKTRAGERKKGLKSKERQLAEIAQQVFNASASWQECDQKFAKMAIRMVFKTKHGKPYGGYLIGPDNRRCSFSKCGEGRSYPALEKRFGAPSPDQSVRANAYGLNPFEYHDDLTMAEAKKRLLPVFLSAVAAGSWRALGAGVDQLGMRLKRSGGGLVVVFNEGRDTIKASEIANKFSLSRLEKVLGPCPRSPAKPVAPNLMRDAKAILADAAARGQGADAACARLADAHIGLTYDDRQVMLTRDGVSMPLSLVFGHASNFYALPWKFYQAVKIYQLRKGRKHAAVAIAMRLRLHEFSRHQITSCFIQDGFSPPKARNLTDWLYSGKGNVIYSNLVKDGTIPRDAEFLLCKNIYRAVCAVQPRPPRLFMDTYGNLIYGTKPGKDKGVGAAWNRLSERSRIDDIVQRHQPNQRHQQNPGRGQTPSM